MELAGELLADTLVWTPAIEDFGLTLARWIRTDHPGAATYGAQRNGKSCAIEYLKSVLVEYLGYPVPICSIVVPRMGPKKSDRERELLQTMMLGVGCRALSSRDKAVLRQRMYEHLRDLAHSAASKRLVIALDEAQNLTFDSYEDLITFQNGLALHNIKTFFLLVGQPELRNQYASWTEQDAYQIVGRFFMRLHYFSGVAPMDIAQVLAGFDDEPAGTSPPIARLLPQAYGSGWRIASLGPYYVQAISFLRQRHNLSDEVHLPMQYLRSSVIGVLDRMVHEKLSHEEVSAAHVLASIHETGFLQALNFYMSVQSDARANGDFQPRSRAQ